MIKNFCIYLTSRIHGFCSENSLRYSNGSTATAVCVCLPGFKRNSGSCQRTTELGFSLKNKFLQLDFIDFPDTSKLDLSPLSFQECESRCIENSSCLALTYKYTGQRNCTHRGGVLSNMFWCPQTETATYLRVAGNESATSNFTSMFSVLNTVCAPMIKLGIPPDEHRTAARNLSIIGSVLALELLVGVLSFWALLRRYSQYRDMARALGFELLPLGGPKQFSFSELRSATKDFRDEVGRGGFGIVYRGELSDGRTVAVKSLKDNIPGSDQDFWAEASIIARMHSCISPSLSRGISPSLLAYLYFLFYLSRALSSSRVCCSHSSSSHTLSDVVGVWFPRITREDLASLIGRLTRGGNEITIVGKESINSRVIESFVPRLPGGTEMLTRRLRRSTPKKHVMNHPTLERVTWQNKETLTLFVFSKNTTFLGSRGLLLSTPVVDLRNS